MHPFSNKTCEAHTYVLDHIHVPVRTSTLVLIYIECNNVILWYLMSPLPLLERHTCRCFIYLFIHFINANNKNKHTNINFKNGKLVFFLSVCVRLTCLCCKNFFHICTQTSMCMRLRLYMNVIYLLYFSTYEMQLSHVFLFLFFLYPSKREGACWFHQSVCYIQEKALKIP